MVASYCGGDEFDVTLEMIGNIIGVSKERVRQIKSKALRKVRSHTSYLKSKGFSVQDIYIDDVIINDADGYGDWSELISKCRTLLKKYNTGKHRTGDSVTAFVRDMKLAGSTKGKKYLHYEKLLRGRVSNAKERAYLDRNTLPGAKDRAVEDRLSLKYAMGRALKERKEFAYSEIEALQSAKGRAIECRMSLHYAIYRALGDRRGEAKLMYALMKEQEEKERIQKAVNSRLLDEISILKALHTFDTMQYGCTLTDEHAAELEKLTKAIGYQTMMKLDEHGKSVQALHEYIIENMNTISSADKASRQAYLIRNGTDENSMTVSDKFIIDNMRNKFIALKYLDMGVPLIEYAVLCRRYGVPY